MLYNLGISRFHHTNKHFQQISHFSRTYSTELNSERVYFFFSLDNCVFKFMLYTLDYPIPVKKQTANNGNRQNATRSQMHARKLELSATHIRTLAQHILPGTFLDPSVNVFLCFLCSMRARKPPPRPNIASRSHIFVLLAEILCSSPPFDNKTIRTNVFALYFAAAMTLNCNSAVALNSRQYRVYRCWDRAGEENHTFMQKRGASQTTK